MMLGSGMIRLVGKSVLAFCSICIIFSSLSFYEIYSEEKAILSTLRRWIPSSVLSNQYSILLRSYIVLYEGMRSYPNPVMRRDNWRRKNPTYCTTSAIALVIVTRNLIYSYLSIVFLLSLYPVLRLKPSCLSICRTNISRWSR